MVEVWLPYGKTEVCARIPTRSFLGSIKPRDSLGVADANIEIVRALREPLGTKPLNKIAKTGDKVAVVVDDHTRFAPSFLMVPHVLNELTKAGVKDGDIVVIFGCGTHRPVKHEEKIKLLGEEVAQRLESVSHSCDSEENVFVGKTKTLNTEVHINRRFVEADIKILTGDIGLHYYAGYGGGRKSVLPAISSRKTIRHNHSFILNPKARTGNLEENRIHEDMVEASKLVKVDFTLNVVINSKAEVVRAFAGDLDKTFYEGVKIVDAMYKVPFSRKAEIVVASSGGDPGDVNLYQAYKGIDNALEAVKKGGVIVLVAECPDGYGQETFFEWMRKYKDIGSLEKAVEKRFEVGGHKAYYMMKALQKAHIILVSSIPDFYAIDVFNLKTARATNDALEMAFNIVGKKGKVLSMPHGNFTLPVFRPTV